MAHPVKPANRWSNPATWWRRSKIPLGHNSSKTSSADAVITTGIIAYNLYKPSGFYSYEWDITNQKNVTYDYEIIDQTNDKYEINTYEGGVHYVRFNSAAPDIKEIRGISR